MPITTHRPKPQEFAAIDLGSNSFHLIIARVVNGAIQVLGRLKQRVRLADGLNEQGMLSDEAIHRGIECLSLFAERLRGFKAENVCIVATHTLREANNAEVFLERAANIIPYPIEIIAGQEEARLIFMGVAHTQPEKGRKLVIDIGGGSTELAIGENFDPLVLESRRMGCVSFANLYFPNGEISAEHFQKAHLAAMQKLESLVWEYRLLGWQSALGASGTIKAICDVLAAQGDKTGLISKAQLVALSQMLLQYRNSSEIDLIGLSEERRPIFLSGIAILLAIFDTLAIKELRRSDGALREGLLYEMEGRLKHQDIRSRTANSLAQHYQIDDAQARRVLACTDQLYQQWAKLNPKLADTQCYALLQWAAMLHEVGLSINHNNLQRHSAYILHNSNLPGFHQEQQLLLATLVRFHRKSIKLEELPRLNLFKKKHYLPLLQILRLAVLLNQQRQASPCLLDVQLTVQQNHWHLTFPAPLLSDNNLLLLVLEKEQSYWQQVESWQLTFSEQPSA